jgi:hypothetical protein
METSPEVGKWRNCEVNLCEPPNQNWGKGIESLPLGFPPYALGLAWRLPSGWHRTCWQNKRPSSYLVALQRTCNQNREMMIVD